jgi:transcriptional regulator with XRE-family HTH domain
VELEDLVKEKPTPTQMLLAVTTPIFTPEIGARLALARMKLLMDQKEFGAKLGIAQQQVSKLEAGRLRTLEKPFTTQALWDALGNSFSFVMYGTGEDRFPPDHVRKTYWDAKAAPKGNRTERFRFWETK